MEEQPKKLITLSLVGTDEEIDQLWKALGDAGWRLKFQGHSGSWLGEPIYEIKKLKKGDPNGF